jgi:hypothetical protein
MRIYCRTHEAADPGRVMPKPCMLDTRGPPRDTSKLQGAQATVGQNHADEHRIQPQSHRIQPFPEHGEEAWGGLRYASPPPSSPSTMPPVGSSNGGGGRTRVDGGKHLLGHRAARAVQSRRQGGETLPHGESKRAKSNTRSKCL